MKAAIWFLVLWGLLATHASARLITLMVVGEQTQDTLFVNTNESLRIVSGRDFYANSMSLRLERNGALMHIGYNQLVGLHPGSDTSWPYNPIQVTGPALITLLSNLPSRATNTPAYVTIEVTPEPVPADQTLVVPQGSAATLTVQGSTNLSDWVVEWSQTYTNSNAHRFFRMKLDKGQ